MLLYLQARPTTTTSAIARENQQLRECNYYSQYQMPTDRAWTYNCYKKKAASTKCQHTEHGRTPVNCHEKTANTAYVTHTAVHLYFPRRKIARIHQKSIKKEDLTLPPEKQPILPAYIPSTARTPVFSNKTMVRLFNKTDPQCL